MSNRLAHETSPYLLQHKNNPVDWYPWCDEAFQKAKREDKPVFLSIGYSACHWCHVFAHESFEDSEIADILNRHFVSVKVDREERPDIGSVYMTFCQAFTGSGGWPTSIFVTADKQPFFAGTYFPKTTRGNFIGFKELLLAIQKSWSSHRTALLQRGEQIISYLSAPGPEQASDADLIAKATKQFEQLYDKTFGGFGSAPKFPSPHNLLFLLDCYEKLKEPACLDMAQHTLMQMYRGGLFDHIGFGFCRYSTDKKYLVPHFEKMLYDNALLIEAYCRLYSITKNPLHLEIAEKTAAFVLRDMTSPQGGFFSSLDADSDGKEGKYYLFTPDEVIQELKENGQAFCRHFDITQNGNFEGENIPNLLNSNPEDSSFEHLLPKLERYRKCRYSLHRDEKILTFQNSLMITAMCRLYLVSRQQKYLQIALSAHRFIQQNLCDGDDLFVSCHMQKRGEKGFLDDYAAYIRALLSLYRATLEPEYLTKAERLIIKVTKDFSDPKGGFYLYGSAHEQLPLRPKETYDGAVPSGNSLMAYNLVCLHALTQKDEYSALLQKQLDFMNAAASSYPVGHAMFLRALLQHSSPSVKITVVSDEHSDKNTLAVALPPYAFVNFLSCPTKEYPLKNNRTTYYVCRGHSCLPPANDLSAVLTEQQLIYARSAKRLKITNLQCSSSASLYSPFYGLYLLIISMISVS